MTNRYLEGNFGPVNHEVTVTDLEVKGEIPDHLDGRYLRIGPNPISTPDPDTYHWFLGTGMVHGLRLGDGKAAWYRNRYVRSADVAAALGEERRPGPVHAGFDLSPNTNVIGHGGRTYAIVEAGPRPYELTDELDTIGPCDFDGTLPGGYTAHPHADPATGELHALSYFWAWGNKVQYSVLGTDGRIRRTVDIEVGGSPMMHDFSLTENHVVIYDLPVTFDPVAAASSMPRALRPIVSRLSGVPTPAPIARWANSRAATAGVFPYRWNPDYQARVGVLARDGGSADVEWFDVEPCYVYHPLNAYEDGDTIVVDLVRHPKSFDTDRNGPFEGPPTLDRWTIDRRAGKVLEDRLDDHPQEFPRIDERLTGRRHRYGYSVGASDASKSVSAFDAVFKHDALTGATTAHSFGTGEASEFVFVPSHADAAEDEGVLMGFVYAPETDTSSLDLLDAATLEPVGSVSLPARVPNGFHGNWVPSSPA